MYHIFFILSYFEEQLDCFQFLAIMNRTAMNMVEQVSDVRFPSVCCEYILLPLVNKEASLAYGRAEYSKVGNPSRDKGGKKVESGRRHGARGKPQALWKI